MSVNVLKEDEMFQYAGSQKYRRDLRWRNHCQLQTIIIVSELFYLTCALALLASEAAIIATILNYLAVFIYSLRAPVSIQVGIYLL